MTFHLMFVHIIFSSGKVAKWPAFGIIATSMSSSEFEGGSWILIAPGPGHCIPFTFNC